jgi:hypothetical protein
MTNFADKLVNRHHELEYNIRVNTPILAIIPISHTTLSARQTLCNSCEYLTSNICSKSGCIIDVIIKSPILTCPVNKWLPV